MTTRSAGVTAPLGFRAAGVAAGLKPSGSLDVAVVVNDGPLASAAGVLTSNRVQAAPVAWTRDVLGNGQLRAVLLNSGGANACTGLAGYEDTVASARHLAKCLEVPADEIAVCSTGLIGERLPMDRLLAGIEQGCASLSVDGGPGAAAAIMTTDTVIKTAVQQRDGIVVAGMAKGAGMLAPGLATMLAVLTTDAIVESEVLNRVLRAATAVSFDRVDSDGCMSTNDTVLILASGASGVAVPESTLSQMVGDVCVDLARQLVSDAEGASKEITIEVTQAVTVSDALMVARAVARSNLFKCAIHGEDPNWGRVLSAVGTTDAVYDPSRLGVAINGVWVAREGAAGADRTAVELSGRQVTVTIALGAGEHSAVIWTNDLTAAYVHENSAYSS